MKRGAIWWDLGLGPGHVLGVSASSKEWTISMNEEIVGGGSRNVRENRVFYVLPSFQGLLGSLR